MEMIVITPDQLTQLINVAVKNAFETYKPETLYTVNQLTKILRCGSRKVNELIKTNELKTTADGRVTEAALKKYLQH